MFIGLNLYTNKEPSGICSLELFTPLLISNKQLLFCLSSPFLCVSVCVIVYVVYCPPLTEQLTIQSFMVEGHRRSRERPALPSRGINFSSSVTHILIHVILQPPILLLRVYVACVCVLYIADAVFALESAQMLLNLCVYIETKRLTRELRV